MRRWLKKISWSFLLLILGAIFGPVLVSLVLTVISVNSQPDPSQIRSEAERLLAIYREEEKNRIVMLRMSMPPDGAECGYDPSKLFPGDQLYDAYKEKRFKPYRGYIHLNQWRRDTKDVEYDWDLIEAIEAKRSPLELGFLRRCASWTLARNFCMARIEDIVKTVGRDVPRSFDETRTSSFFGYGTENSILCLYADGVAARQGLPLSEQEPQ